MPTGSVRLESIRKLGQENHSYEFSDEGNVLLRTIWNTGKNDLFKLINL